MNLVVGRTVLVSRHYFSDATALNWKGKLAWFGKQLLLRVGVRGSGETFLFQARQA